MSPHSRSGYLLRHRVLSACLALVFLLSFTAQSVPAGAQGIGLLGLPVPGAMVQPSAAFTPVLLKGMTIHPEDPLRFDFIVDGGDASLPPSQIRQESERLVKYFLASMTVPQNELWVNLSPHEADRIIPDELAKTELGRDLLAQDYLLKQLTASLVYPEKELGKKFWKTVRAKAQERFGTAEIPMSTFNKVWILPESATVYEHENTVYVVKSRLKVLTDQEYQVSSEERIANSHGEGLNANRLSLDAKVIREIIIPEIEREVNEGKHFAPLRQIYHSLILAKWYKETIQESLLTHVYVNQNKVAGVDGVDEGLKTEIYDRYIRAYKKGVFNYIKKDYDELSQKEIPRKYFSGGFRDRKIKFVSSDDSMLATELKNAQQPFQLELVMRPQGKVVPATDSDSLEKLKTRTEMEAVYMARRMIEKAKHSKELYELARIPGDKWWHRDIRREAEESIFQLNSERMLAETERMLADARKRIAAATVPEDIKDLVNIRGDAWWHQDIRREAWLKIKSLERKQRLSLLDIKVSGAVDRMSAANRLALVEIDGRRFFLSEVDVYARGLRKLPDSELKEEEQRVARALGVREDPKLQPYMIETERLQQGVDGQPADLAMVADIPSLQGQISEKKTRTGMRHLKDSLGRVARALEPDEILDLKKLPGSEWWHFPVRKAAADKIDLLREQKKDGGSSLTKIAEQRIAQATTLADILDLLTIPGDGAKQRAIRIQAAAKISKFELTEDEDALFKDVLARIPRALAPSRTAAEDESNALEGKEDEEDGKKLLKTARGRFSRATARGDIIDLANIPGNTWRHMLVREQAKAKIEQLERERQERGGKRFLAESRERLATAIDPDEIRDLTGIRGHEPWHRTIRKEAEEKIELLDKADRASLARKWTPGENKVLTILNKADDLAFSVLFELTAIQTQDLPAQEKEEGFDKIKQGIAQIIGLEQGYNGDGAQRSEQQATAIKELFRVLKREARPILDQGAKLSKTMEDVVFDAVHEFSLQVARLQKALFAGHFRSETVDPAMLTGEPFGDPDKDVLEVLNKIDNEVFSLLVELKGSTMETMSQEQLGKIFSRARGQIRNILRIEKEYWNNGRGKTVRQRAMIKGLFRDFTNPANSFLQEQVKVNDFTMKFLFNIVTGLSQKMGALKRTFEVEDQQNNNLDPAVLTEGEREIKDIVSQIEELTFAILVSLTRIKIGENSAVEKEADFQEIKEKIKRILEIDRDHRQRKILRTEQQTLAVQDLFNAFRLPAEGILKKDVVLNGVTEQSLLNMVTALGARAYFLKEKMQSGQLGAEAHDPAMLALVDLFESLERNWPRIKAVFVEHDGRETFSDDERARLTAVLEQIRSLQGALGVILWDERLFKQLETTYPWREWPHVRSLDTNLRVLGDRIDEALDGGKMISSPVLFTYMEGVVSMFLKQLSEFFLADENEKNLGLEKGVDKNTVIKDQNDFDSLMDERTIFSDYNDIEPQLTNSERVVMTIRPEESVKQILEESNITRRFKELSAEIVKDLSLERIDIKLVDFSDALINKLSSRGYRHFLQFMVVDPRTVLPGKNRPTLYVDAKFYHHVISGSKRGVRDYKIIAEFAFTANAYVDYLREQLSRVTKEDEERPGFDVPVDIQEMVTRLLVKLTDKRFDVIKNSYNHFSHFLDLRVKEVKWDAPEPGLDVNAGNAQNRKYFQDLINEYEKWRSAEIRYRFLSQGQLIRGLMEEIKKALWLRQEIPGSFDGLERTVLFDSISYSGLERLMFFVQKNKKEELINRMMFVLDRHVIPGIHLAREFQENLNKRFRGKVLIDSITQTDKKIPGVGYSYHIKVLDPDVNARELIAMIEEYNGNKLLKVESLDPELVVRFPYSGMRGTRYVISGLGESRAGVQAGLQSIIDEEKKEFFDLRQEVFLPDSFAENWRRSADRRTLLQDSIKAGTPLEDIIYFALSASLENETGDIYKDSFTDIFERARDLLREVNQQKREAGIDPLLNIDQAAEVLNEGLQYIRHDNRGSLFGFDKYYYKKESARHIDRALGKLINDIKKADLHRHNSGSVRPFLALLCYLKTPGNSWFRREFVKAFAKNSVNDFIRGAMSEIPEYADVDYEFAKALYLTEPELKTLEDRLQGISLKELPSLTMESFDIDTKFILSKALYEMEKHMTFSYEGGTEARSMEAYFYYLQAPKILLSDPRYAEILIYDEVMQAHQEGIVGLEISTRLLRNNKKKLSPDDIVMAEAYQRGLSRARDEIRQQGGEMDAYFAMAIRKEPHAVIDADVYQSIQMIPDEDKKRQALLAAYEEYIDHAVDKAEILKEEYGVDIRGIDSVGSELDFDEDLAAVMLRCFVRAQDIIKNIKAHIVEIYPEGKKEEAVRRLDDFLDHFSRFGHIVGAMTRPETYEGYILQQKVLTKIVRKNALIEFNPASNFFLTPLNRRGYINHFTHFGLKAGIPFVLSVDNNHIFPNLTQTAGNSQTLTSEYVLFIKTHPIVSIFDIMKIAKRSMDHIWKADSKQGDSSRLALTGDKEKGGIDLNEIDINREGEGPEIRFNPADIKDLEDMVIDGIPMSEVTGFAPVIINFTPLPSVLPLLGLEPRRDEEIELSAVKS